MSEELHEYVLKQSRYSTVSEYIRSVIRNERRRREDYVARPIAAPRPVNEMFVLANVIEQLDKLKAMLEHNDTERE